MTAYDRAAVTIRDGSEIVVRTFSFSGDGTGLGMTAPSRAAFFETTFFLHVASHSITHHHMSRERTSISLDGELYAAALALCAKERENRDFSNLCEVALRDYLTARGALPGDVAMKAEIIAAAEQIGLPVALDNLRRRLRTAGRQAA